MTTTTAQLGARALRKLGVAIVADASRPGAAAPVTSAGVALDMMLQMGIPVPLADQPATLPPVAQADIAARALEAVGANPAALTASIGTGDVWALADVATAALLKLAVIAPDDDLTESDRAADQASAVGRASSVHDMLVATDYVTWTASEIPGGAFEFYVIMVANLLAPQFGKPAAMDAFTAAEGMIRQQALSGVNGQAIAAEKVADVHEELNALGLVAWPISAVPAAQAEQYVDMAAARLAPIYKTLAPEEITAGAARYTAAIGAIRRAGLLRGVQARAAVRVGLVHEELNALGLVTWTVDTIPAALSDLYTAMASSKMVAEGGKPMEPAEYAAFIQRVRMVAMGGPAGQALAEQKVLAVQYSLEARGRARWGVYDIPVWAEEPLVLKAATLLGPECGVKVDPAWDTQAEMELMRIVSLPSLREPVRAEYF